jgi:anaerobic magnesium-protoporphyrin IX monomethyl ester cyclase
MKYAFYITDNFALGPAYLITYLRSQGHEVKLFFDPMLFKDEDYNVKRIEEYHPDACLFSCLTPTYNSALRIASKVKEKVGCKIIFGGVHSSTVPEVVRENKFIDEVCVGEGIKFFGGVFDQDTLIPTRKDFNEVLSPRDILYPYIITSFDCPFCCTYCQPVKLKIKRRGVAVCIQETIELKNNKARSIAIWDDVFTSDKVWLKDFLDKWKKDVKLPFRCISHVKFINEDIVAQLKDAGCYLIDIGIQTGSEKLRKDILNRHETNEDILKACALIKKYRIKLIIDHMVYLPQESEATNLESYNLYKQIAPDMVTVYRLVYFPKTKIIEHAIKNNILTLSDVPKIERGEFGGFASGLNKDKNKNPWINKFLSVPLKGRWWKYCNENILNLILYYRLDESFNPWHIISRYIFYWRVRWLR